GAPRHRVVDAWRVHRTDGPLSCRLFRGRPRRTGRRPCGRARRHHGDRAAAHGTRRHGGRRPDHGHEDARGRADAARAEAGVVCYAPTVFLNLSFSATPSRVGNTRGGSVGVIATRATSVCVNVASNSARRARPASSLTSIVKPMPHAAAALARSTVSRAWLAWLPVSP